MSLSSPIAHPDFEAQAVGTSPIPQALAYLREFGDQLHRYPEEEYGELLRAVAENTGWPLEGLFLCRSVPEALDYFCEILMAPGDTAAVADAHPYRAVLARQVETRQGSLVSLEQSPLAALAKIWFETKTPVEPVTADVRPVPGLPQVLLNPRQLFPQAIHLFELPWDLSPTPPVVGFCTDFAFVRTFRKVGEPFHMPTHLLVLLKATLQERSDIFPRASAAEGSLQTPPLQGVLPAVEAIQPYVPGKGVKAMARERGLPPSAFVKLASNEHPFGVRLEMLHTLEALLASWQNGAVTYGDVAERLKVNILHSLGLDQSFPAWSTAQVQLGTGSVDLIKAAVKAFIPPSGGTMLFPALPFAMYPFEAVKRPARVVTAPLEPHHQLSLPRFIETLQTEKPDLIVLANPRNPLGTGLDDLEPLMEALTPDQVLILDEAYREFIRWEMGASRYPDGAQLIQAHPDKNILALRTFSKSHALASFRLGYSLSGTALAQRLASVLLPCNVDPLTLAAGIAALETPGWEAWLEETVRFVAEEKRRFYALFEALGLPFVRSYANFVFFETGETWTAAALNHALLNHGVIIRPVGERYMRVNVGRAEENDAFIRAMQDLYDPNRA